jgi:hypothetical protein
MGVGCLISWIRYPFVISGAKEYQNHQTDMDTVVCQTVARLVS